MTTVVLTPTYAGRDGLSCLARDVSRVLARLGSTRVLSLADDDDRGAIEVLGCAGGRRRFVGRALALAARRPEVLVVLHTHLLPVALPFLAAGARLVHVLVGIESWRPLPLAQSGPLRRASALAAISHHTMRRFREANPGLAQLPVTVCHPSTPVLAPATPGADMPDAGFALIVGRMAADERYKGHDALIDAWPSVRQRCPDARLVVAGTGDDRARLEARVVAAGLSCAIRFVGSVDAGELAALYERAAVLVLPSRHEGFGYVFLEAMSAGRACIGTRGAAEEIIDHGVSGLIVDPPEGAPLVEAVTACLADAETSARMGAAGRIRAATVFAPERFADQLSLIVHEARAC